MKEFTVPNSLNFNATLDHLFITHCNLLEPITPFYLAYANLWLAITLLWVYHVWVRHRQNSMPLQKMLLLIPICKSIECFMYYGYLLQCPWITTDATVRYIAMAYISTVTIFNTLFLSMVYVISRGWGIIRFFLTRQNATTVTMLMGAVYLVFSAYFISKDF